MLPPLEGSGGFRVQLEKAIRVNDHCDWSPHTLDYAVFKQILKKLCHRRYNIRSMLRKSPDGKLSHDVVEKELGTSILVDFPDKTDLGGGRADINNNNNNIGKQSSNDDSSGEGDAAIHNNYINMLEMEGFGRVDSSFSSQSGSGGSHKTKRKSRVSVLRNLSFLERKELVAFLKSELEKAQMFYLAQWQRVSNMLEQEQQSPPQQPHNNNHHPHHHPQAYHAAGDEILELMAYCAINVVAVCQCLIRYDAFARTYEGTPMLDYWIKHHSRFATPFRKLVQHEELMALADVYAATLQRHDETLILQQFEAQRSIFAEILAATKTAQNMASSGHVFFRDSIVQTLRSGFLMGSFEDRLGLEPSYLVMRGQSLTPEIARLVEWRKKKQDMLLPSPLEKKKKKQLTSMQVFNLTLNLLSAFLYCMNYYIVEPSSTMYVNRLGAFDAMSGTLIGMVPLAAFVSSIPFSMWTNTSFRSPFILSCCLLLIGNILYSIADQFGDVRVALLGRFITGLGAPKCIIRRYMADTTPMTLRTKVNALFGMVVAAGSAMGPAMAIVLNQFEYTFAAPVMGLVTLNGLTLPGYFMAMLWLTFTIIVLLTFEEPSRDGLEEQRQMENASRIPDDLVSIGSGERINDSDLNTIFSGDSQGTGSRSFYHKAGGADLYRSPVMGIPVSSLEVPSEHVSGWRGKLISKYLTLRNYLDLITMPVRLCLGLLFAKVFTIEILVSATSALSKNRYKWQIQQVGSLGLVNGCLVIPFSIFIGRLSLSLQDRQLMRYLVATGIFGLFLLIDLSDFVYSENGSYNDGHALAVGPRRYVSGYFISYLSIQAFEGVIGSTLSKVIPTTLASGTFNSGLLATLVDTFGRACGDNFISMMGFISIRQLMNLLFVPGFLIMLSCLIVLERYRDLLSV